MRQINHITNKPTAFCRLYHSVKFRSQLRPEAITLRYGFMKTRCFWFVYSIMKLRHLKYVSRWTKTEMSFDYIDTYHYWMRCLWFLISSNGKPKNHPNFSKNGRSMKGMADQRSKLNTMLGTTLSLTNTMEWAEFVLS